MLNEQGPIDSFAKSPEQSFILVQGKVQAFCDWLLRHKLATEFEVAAACRALSDWYDPVQAVSRYEPITDEDFAPGLLAEEPRS